MHEAVLERVGMRKHAIGLFGVPHVFLDAEVVDAEVEMQRRRHADRTQVGGAMRSGAHLVQLGEGRDLAQMADAAGAHHRGADVVDQLFAE